MLKEFAKHVRAETGRIFNPKTDRIRCIWDICFIFSSNMYSS
jgi:hypothetical protein